MAVTIDGTVGVTSPNFTGDIQGATGTFSGAVQSSGLATNLYPLIERTAQAASAAGTSVAFTDIPSWVTRITVVLTAVSTSGTSQMLVQLGTGDPVTYANTGYAGSAAITTGATVTAFSTGFMINNSVAAASVVNGIITIVNITSNTWVESGTLGLSDSAGTRYSAGSVTLSAALTALRVTMVNGTDTFDAGTINILYE